MKWSKYGKRLELIGDNMYQQLPEVKDCCFNKGYKLKNGVAKCVIWQGE